MYFNFFQGTKVPRTPPFLTSFLLRYKPFEKVQKRGYLAPPFPKVDKYIEVLKLSLYCFQQIIYIIFEKLII